MAEVLQRRRGRQDSRSLSGRDQRDGSSPGTLWISRRGRLEIQDRGHRPRGGRTRRGGDGRYERQRVASEIELGAVRSGPFRHRDRRGRAAVVIPIATSTLPIATSNWPAVRASAICGGTARQRHQSGRFRSVGRPKAGRHGRRRLVVAVRRPGHDLGPRPLAGRQHDGRARPSRPPPPRPRG